MRVRIRQSERHDGWYIIDTRPSWWPFWSYATMETSKEEALERAKIFKNPEIIEITDET